MEYAMIDFSDDQIDRYARHLVLPEIGEEGQARLLGSKVLVIGAGGLGSPLLLYLAAAGVGTLGVIDDDQVDLSNLQRQVLHDTSRIGQDKVESGPRPAGGDQSGGQGGRPSDPPAAGEPRCP